MFICIEGNIGSGKSTIAKTLATKLKAQYLPEQFEQNTLLPLFYQKPKTFAFPTEYSFLLERQKQLTTYFSSVKNNVHTISDFHFDKSLCFAKTNLSAKDYSYLKKHFKSLKQSVPTPDLVVYLDASVELTKNNIKTRGRIIEKKLKKPYLGKLKKHLDKYYIVNGDINTLVLILTIKEYNDLTLEACCAEIIETIKLIKK